MSYLGEVSADLLSTLWPLNESSGTSAAVMGTDDGVDRTGTYVGSPALGGAGLIATNSAVETVSNSYVVLIRPTVNTGVNNSIELWFEYVSGSAPIFRDNHATGGWYFDLSGTHPVVSERSAAHTVTTVTSASLKDGARHHFVLTSAGSRVILYLDGVQVDTWVTTAADPTETPAYTFLLGKDGANATYTRARYAAFAIYRETLGADRVAAHYAAADDHVVGTAVVTVTPQATPPHVPGAGEVSVVALPIAVSAPVNTRSSFVLTSTTTDATTDAPEAVTLVRSPLHIVSPAVPAPTLVDGRPQ